MENQTGKAFGKELLLSVRSSAISIMPGLAEAILNLGMNDEVYSRMVMETKNERFAAEVYLNSMITFLYAVLPDDSIHEFEGIDHDIIIGYLREGYGDISTEKMKEAINGYKELYKNLFGNSFPEDAKEQLIIAIKAMYRSCRAKRSEVYRRMNEIDNTLNMEIVIQEMVFGNVGKNSVTGYVFSRDFQTGDNKIYPLFTEVSQINKYYIHDKISDYSSELSKVSPPCINEITRLCKILEAHYKDMQRIDLVVEDNKPYILMSEKGNRSAEASLNIAVDLVKEGIIKDSEAVDRLSPNELREIKLSVFQKEQTRAARKIIKGLGASKGVITGKVYFDIESIER